MTSLTYRYVALTDTGLRRPHNEDSGYASSRLLVVADGMGGAAAGELASSETMHVIRELDRDLDVDAMTAMEGAVDSANARLAALIAEDPAVEGMGTTLEAMLWDGEKLAVAHLGDSRAYRLRGGVLEQISTDHTFVQALVEEGKITPEEARVHPHRNLIVRAMLGRDDNAADLSWIQPMLGDRYLLCSDGLSDMVDDETIRGALGAETIDFAATELVRLALEGGGYDNVTVVIAEFVEAGTEPEGNLSSADGQPQLVGAAASQPRPRTGKGSVDTREASSLDPEELRYAPRPPSRLRWLRWTLVGVLVAAIIGAGAAFTYHWSQTQYFVASHDGKVTIFKGVQANVPGIKLQHVEQVTDVVVTSLPEYRREQVRAGIEASSKADAQQIVANLSQFAVAPTPKPSPSPTKKKSSKTTNTVWRR
jgi:protein phosphatase